MQKLDRVEELGRDFQVTTCTDKAQPVAKGSTAQKATAECRFMRDSAGRATSDLSRESLRVREHQQSAAGTLQPMAYAKHSGHPAPDLPGASESHCWRWEAVEEMVIYGLGSLEASPVPRYQLAFALLLAERLPKLKGPLQAFDPVFTELDCALLKEQGLLVRIFSASPHFSIMSNAACVRQPQPSREHVPAKRETAGSACLWEERDPLVRVLPLQEMCSAHGLVPRQVLEENEEGRRRAAQPTLFYLPHCEADLTSNLVEANLHSGGGGGGAGRVAVLGNSFALYRERWAQVGSTQAQHRRGRPDALLRAVEAGQVLEVPVSDCGFPVVSAFNDMSFHLFRDASAPCLYLLNPHLWNWLTCFKQVGHITLRLGPTLTS